jgi:GNAT superfamily N-acetyltransferase
MGWESLGAWSRNLWALDHATLKGYQSSENQENSHSNDCQADQVADRVQANNSQAEHHKDSTKDCPLLVHGSARTDGDDIRLAQGASMRSRTIQALFWKNPERPARGFGRLRIRPLRRRDFSSVREIYKTVSTEYLQYQRQRSGEVYDPVGTDLETSQLDFYRATHTSFVAVENEKLLGVLLAQTLKWVNDWNKVLWLEYIAVHPAHRRRGIGLALISSAKDFARKHDTKGLFATLNVDNDESKSFLLKAGFDVKDWRIASYTS